MMTYNTCFELFLFAASSSVGGEEDTMVEERRLITNNEEEAFISLKTSSERKSLTQQSFESYNIIKLCFLQFSFFPPQTKFFPRFTPHNSIFSLFGLIHSHFYS